MSPSQKIPILNIMTDRRLSLLRRALLAFAIGMLTMVGGAGYAANTMTMSLTDRIVSGIVTGGMIIAGGLALYSAHA